MRHKTRHPVWRGAVLLALVGLLLTATGTAGAKPGSGKPEPPQEYEVTMAEALATACPGFAPSATMTSFGNVIEGRRQNLATDIDLGWKRNIDIGYGTSGTVLTGCHGNALPGSENDLYALWITLYPKEQAVKVWWRFDPAFDAQGNPQELFELLSNPSRSRAGKVAWANGVVHGEFLLRRWNHGQGWTDLGSVHLNFTLTIEETSS